MRIKNISFVMICVIIFTGGFCVGFLVSDIGNKINVPLRLKAEIEKIKDGDIKILNAQFVEGKKKIKR
jgi:hypothetical protein